MHRFYLPPADCRQDPMTLSERESHHARNVLRLRKGERVVVLDGAGHEFLCQVLDPDGPAVPLAVLQKSDLPPPACPVTLLQAVTRARSMDLIVQKATELGAHRIVPLLSERTVAQVDAADAAGKAGKWGAIAVEALKQCGTPWLPHVDEPLTPQAFLARGEKFELPLIASLQGDARHPRVPFDAFRADFKRLPQSVCVWVGPEGDFTPAEIHAVRSAGALPVSLGRWVLRSETAAIYCLSVIQYELQA